MGLSRSDRRRRIVLVDADPVLLRLYRQALEDRYDVRTFRSAIEALDKLSDADLVVTDVDPRDGRGLKLLMAAARLRPGMPCIVLTSPLDNAMRGLLAMLGASFLLKPFPLARLVERAEALLAARAEELLAKLRGRLRERGGACWN